MSLLFAPPAPQAPEAPRVPDHRSLSRGRSPSASPLWGAARRDVTPPTRRRSLTPGRASRDAAPPPTETLADSPSVDRYGPTASPMFTSPGAWGDGEGRRGEETQATLAPDQEGLGEGFGQVGRGTADGNAGQCSAFSTRFLRLPFAACSYRLFFSRSIALRGLNLPPPPLSHVFFSCSQLVPTPRLRCRLLPCRLAVRWSRRHLRSVG